MDNQTLDKRIILGREIFRDQLAANEEKRAAFAAQYGGRLNSQVTNPPANPSDTQANLAATPSLTELSTPHVSSQAVSSQAETNLSLEVEKLVAPLSYISDQTTRDRVVLHMAISGDYSEEIRQALIRYPNYTHLEKDYTAFYNTLVLLERIKVDSIKENVIQASLKNTLYPDLIREELAKRSS